MTGQAVARATERAGILSERYSGLDGPALLRPLILNEFPARIALVASFGSESAVLVAQCAEIDPTLPIIFLDTRKHFGETLRYRDLIAKRVGARDVRIVRPDTEDLDRFDPDGGLWSTKPDLCCHIRKTAPLTRALAGFEAWITGRKRYHGGSRTELPVLESIGDKIKVNPLATWSRARVEADFRERALPKHPLEENGFQSVGCMPCTARTAPDADMRSGRWSGLAKIECGIHLAPLRRPRD